MQYVIWIQIKWYKKKIRIDYEHTMNGLLTSKELQRRRFSPRVYGLKEID